MFYYFGSFIYVVYVFNIIFVVFTYELKKYRLFIFLISY